jgi:WD40 repeat protein
MWNTSNGVCERTLEGHTDYIKNMILLSDGRICSVSYDGSFKILNLETGVCDLTVQICNSALYKVVQLHDGRLVVCNDKNKAYIIGA